MLNAYILLIKLYSTINLFFNREFIKLYIFSKTIVFIEFLSLLHARFFRIRTLRANANYLPLKRINILALYNRSTGFIEHFRATTGSKSQNRSSASNCLHINRRIVILTRRVNKHVSCRIKLSQLLLILSTKILFKF